MSDPDMFPTEICVLPSGMERTDSERGHFAIRVRYRGTYVRRGTDDVQDWYSIENGGSELSRAGKWKFCPEKFQTWQYRHTLDDAIELAFQHIESVKIGGRTWAEWRAERVAS